MFAITMKTNETTSTTMFSLTSTRTTITMTFTLTRITVVFIFPRIATVLTFTRIITTLRTVTTPTHFYTSLRIRDILFYVLIEKVLVY